MNPAVAPQLTHDLNTDEFHSYSLAVHTASKRDPAGQYDKTRYKVRGDPPSRKLTVTTRLAYLRQESRHFTSVPDPLFR